MSHSLSRLTFAAAAVGLLAPLSAAADEPVVVTLIDMSVDGAAQGEMAHSVARAIRRNAQLRYRDVNETLNVGGEDLHVSNARSAKGLLRSALNRMKVKEYEDAAEELESAVTNLSISFAHVPDQSMVTRVLLLHGTALLLSGEKVASHKAFIRACEFKPKLKAKAVLEPYGAKTLKAWEMARSEVFNREMITYEVTSKPAHAEVWVNGTYFGLTPTYVRRFRGAQYIRINKHGHGRLSKVIQMKKGKVVAVQLKEARRLPAYASIRERLDEVFDGAVEANDLSEAQGLLNSGRAVFLKVTGTREKMNVQLALANLSGRQVVKRLNRKMSWLRVDKAANAAIEKDRKSVV